MPWATIAVLAFVLIAGERAGAQTTSRPGPWVLDVRGVTSPVPQETVFFPPLRTGVLIPTRGFGMDLGGHVYLFNLGASRVGIGATVVAIRASTNPPQAQSTPGTTSPAPTGQALRLEMVHMSPQVSFNFGRRDGWSYVSAGMGSTVVKTTTAGASAGTRATGELWDLQRLWRVEDFNQINFGGGARWFLNSHVAFGFDLRFHRVDAGTAGEIMLATTPSADPRNPPPSATPVPPEPTPGKMFLTVGAGFSLR